MALVVREVRPADCEWVRRLLTERWASVRVVSRGRVHQADALLALVVEGEEGLVGLATYRIDGDECELVTLDSVAEGRGVGAALLTAVAEAARGAGCRRLWLITTNDNVRALGFYQKRGLSLVAVHRDALERSRELKPSIPRVGMDGIPLRDEIELEMWLDR